MAPEEHREEIRTSDESSSGYDLGSFSFLKSGWWIWHVVAIGIIFYLGYLLGGSIF
ncbi:MAG: hypothetical protein FWG36_10240 [Oscillospiraceae bacterium]|nr:hypothetical protein [Oscillospiraceae bacterium]